MKKTATVREAEEAGSTEAGAGGDEATGDRGRGREGNVLGEEKQGRRPAWQELARGGSRPGKEKAGDERGEARETVGRARARR